MMTGESLKLCIFVSLLGGVLKVQGNHEDKSCGPFLADTHQIAAGRILAPS